MAITYQYLVLVEYQLPQAQVIAKPDPNHPVSTW